MKSPFPVTKLDYQIVRLVIHKDFSDIPGTTMGSTLADDSLNPKDKLRLMNMHDSAEKTLSIMRK
jgi:hypothetical protein